MHIVVLEEANIRTHLSPNAIAETRWDIIEEGEVVFEQHRDYVNYGCYVSGRMVFRKIYGKVTVKTLHGVILAEYGGRYKNNVVETSLKLSEPIPLRNVKFQSRDDQIFMEVTNHLEQRCRYVVDNPIQDMIFFGLNKDGVERTLPTCTVYDDVRVSSNHYAKTYIGNLWYFADNLSQYPQSTDGKPITIDDDDRFYFSALRGEGEVTSDAWVALKEITNIPENERHVNWSDGVDLRQLTELRGRFYRVFD